jgi:polyhydroxyalkanoate synthesis regulator phasin
MSDERLAELEHEIRERDKRELTDIRGKLDIICSQLAVLREEFAKNADLERLEARVAQLEAERLKLVGGFFVLQAVGGLLMFVLTKLWK